MLSRMICFQEISLTAFQIGLRIGRTHNHDNMYIMIICNHDNMYIILCYNTIKRIGKTAGQ